VNHPLQLRPGPIYQKEVVVRDPEYRRFIKRLPCAACLKAWRIDPAHTGPHAYGVKACDLKCIPLCRKCHDLFDADPYGFAESPKLDIPALIAKFNSFYQTKIKKAAA
jgi:hypothetical protein